MNLLAFDTTTDVLSIAVQRGLGDLAQCWHHAAPGGALSSATLIPAIAELMAQAGLAYADLTVIAFGRGPGSFTGLRTACAVAQGLAFGAGVPVLPIDSLLAVAEEARWQQPQALGTGQVLALLDARMNELYAASYGWGPLGWTCVMPPCLLRPEDLQAPARTLLAGNVFAPYAGRLGGGGLPRIECLPGAPAMLRLVPALLAAGGALAPELALPLYVRDKVAQTMRERATAQGAAR